MWKTDKSTSENAAEFAWQKDDVFGRIAERYDLLCDLFSFGIHRLWKRRVAKIIANEKWLTLLDGATGTGDIILRVIKQDASYERTIIAADISEKMLGIAQRRLAAHSAKIMFRQINAEAMTNVPSNSVDAYSISLCLKICNRNLALKEAMRVLRPGGRIIILEASNIPWRLLNQAYLSYMALCMPLLGWIATGGDASAYKYLLQGVRDFPTAEMLASELKAQGFDEVEYERLSFGIVAIHTAKKPEE